MTCEKIICAGFGGQGIMSLGQLLAYAGMLEGQQVTWMPSYGPEMRGGTANCSVIVSTAPIGSPLIIDDATCAIVMNLPSLPKFEPAIRSGGRLFINSSLIDQQSKRTDLQAYYLPALEEAMQCGSPQVANIIMLGAYLEVTELVRKNTIIRAFDQVFPAQSKTLRKRNRLALERGAQLLREQTVISAAA